MFMIGIAFLIMAIPFILIILGLVNVKKKMFTALLQITCGIAILLVVFWDWAEDLGIAARISLGEALLILPMFVFAYIAGEKLADGTKSNKTSAAYQSPTANHRANDERMEQMELFDKAAADFEYIVLSLPNIQNQEIASLTKQLIKTATNLFHYVNEKPERMILAKEFVNYYQDRTAELLKQYRVLKELGVRTEVFYKLERDMTLTFQGFIAAYEKQIEKVVDADVMNMEAEMKVALQVMHGDGIDCESRVNCGNIANVMPDEVKATMPKPEMPEKSKGNGINFKYVGLAAGAVLGVVVGAYNFFGNKKDNG